MFCLLQQPLTNSALDAQLHSWQAMHTHAMLGSHVRICTSPPAMCHIIRHLLYALETLHACLESSRFIRPSILIIVAYHNAVIA